MPLNLSKVTGDTLTATEVNTIGAAIDANETALAGKQESLVSGTNIKTVNGNNILGSGNLTVTASESQSALTYAASLAVDFSQADTVRTIAMTGNITFADSTNKAAGRSKVLIITADGSARTLAFPAGWVFLGEVAPTSIAAGKTAVLSLYCRGTAESDVIASYSVQL